MSQADDRSLLLISTPLHVLQIFAIPPTQLPQDSHQKERFPAPVEILSIPSLTYAPGIRKASLTRGAEKVVSAQFIDAAEGNMVLLLLAGSGKGMSSFSLAMLDLRSGEVIKRIDVGHGDGAGFCASKKAIVVVSIPQTRIWQRS